MTLAPSTTTKKIWRALPGQLKALLSREAELDEPEMSRAWTPVAGMYVAELQLVEPRTCTLYLGFELPLAIACSGALMMLPANAIAEKVRDRELSDDDLDAMGECVNTLCTQLNAAVRSELGEEYRVVFRQGSLAEPDVGVLGEHAVARGNLRVGELAQGLFDLVVPRDFFDAVSAHERNDGAAPREAGEMRAGTPRSPGAPAGEEPSARTRQAQFSGAPSGAGVTLTAEELDALREATRDGGSSRTMVLVERTSEQPAWVDLKTQGLDVELCSSPQTALRACERGEIEVLVIDADACTSGGLAMLAMLRGEACRSIQRLIAVSLPTRSHLVACLAAGASNYLVKPLEPSQIIERIAEHGGR
jgi:CheY-like chemotaxis protein